LGNFSDNGRNGKKKCYVMLWLGKRNRVQSKGESFASTAVVYGAGAPLGVRSCISLFGLRWGGGNRGIRSNKHVA